MTSPTPVNGVRSQPEKTAAPATPDHAERSLRRRADAAVESVRAAFDWKVPVVGVTGQLVVVFAGVTVLFGLGASAIVYFLSFDVFETQINQRADVIAMNLAESIASPVQEKNFNAVRQELFKYSAQEDVAYVFVEDEKGNTVAAPTERPRSADSGSIFDASARFSRWATVSYRGKSVNESRAGIQDGKLGMLHLGIWTNAVEKEIRRIFWPIALAIFLLVIIGVMTFSLAIRGISKLLLQLAHSANRISEGQLDTSSWINRRDEIGKLAVSLERIRASLLAATKRLDPQSARPKPANDDAQLSSPRL